MKIVVFGASGKTGSQLLHEALTSGHKVIAYVRKPESILIKHPNLTVLLDNSTPGRINQWCQN